MSQSPTFSHFAFKNRIPSTTQKFFERSVCSELLKTDCSRNCLSIRSQFLRKGVTKTAQFRDFFTFHTDCSRFFFRVTNLPTLIAQFYFFIRLVSCPGPYFLFYVRIRGLFAVLLFLLNECYKNHTACILMDKKKTFFEYSWC